MHIIWSWTLEFRARGSRALGLVPSSQGQHNSTVFFPSRLEYTARAQGVTESPAKPPKAQELAQVRPATMLGVFRSLLFPTSHFH